MKRKITRKLTACLMVLVLTATLFTGCGTSGTETTNPDTPGADSETVTKENPDGIAMGRFVEQEVELGDNGLTDWNSRVFQQADGSLLLSDNSGFVLRSRDNGASWVKEDLDWLKQMKEEDKYILTMAFGPDQTAAVIWTEPEEGSVDDGNGVQLKMDMQLTIVKPDSTIIPAELKLEADDVWVNGVSISNDGRIFASTLSSNL